ncbi:hypothetical protein C8Q70DRAFT_1045314 [Cubamyces menziesii]|nr:hypothetical protein C8Q70DRAFT_1045314 [Cubamyces menziesii]
MPHTLLTLNYDVLSQILALISPHDAAQLALASRAAYALALPRIVSDVTLGGLYHKPGGSALSQLTAFSNFVLSPAPEWLGAPYARLDALQSLHVMRDAVRVRKNGVWTVDTNAVSLLSAVISRARNLQKLTLWGSDALFAAFPDFGLNSSPSIHTLVLGGDVPPLPVLAHAFPNVRTLEFIAGGGSCAPDWALFTANDTGDAAALGAWQKKLDRVDAGFPILPLACPVRRVDLRNPLVSDTYMLFCAREFLRRTRPVVLSASVSSELTEEELCAVLDGEVVAPGLRFLELVGDRCKGVKEGSEWMTHVANTLTTLQIPILGISLSITPSIPLMIVPSALKASHEIIRTPTTTSEPVDLVALARTIVEHAPSLRFVALDLSSAPGGSASKSKQAWFRVYDVGKQRKVEQVSESEGREIQRKMRSFNRWD